MTIIRNELDKRIKKFSDIQSFKQYNDKYIGETGYFSDTISGFKNFTRCLRATLQSIYNKHDYDDLANDYIFDSGTNCWRYFLPESLVKKKYRPLTEDEFKQMLNEGVFGQWVTLKNTADNKESCFQIVGYFHAPDDTFAVCFGSHEFSLQTLFDYYQWKDKDGNWRIFGVEE
jgi:hypothetical protein